MLFQKTSTRTRCSFEAGVSELGGSPFYLEWAKSNFTLAALEDEIKALSRYVDLIMARVCRHTDLVTMANYSEVPVINGLCDLYHPCQSLADYMTIKEYFGELKGLKLAYIGDGNNVCHSLMNGATKTGVEMSISTPKGYEPNQEIVGSCIENGLNVTLYDDPYVAVEEADVLYTDTWVSMGDEAQAEVRLAAFKPFQVNRKLVSHAPKHALIMHCLPAHRDHEITTDVLLSRNSVVFDQAENRKHVQKALILSILGNLKQG